MATCAVCCEKFTLQIRKKIGCPYCEFSACSECHARYLTGTTERAHCMSCRKGWTREVLFTNFTSKFLNKTYKEHRENALFERERSLMPETQPHVEMEIIMRKITKENEKKALEIKDLQIEHNKLAISDLGLMGKETWLEARIERHLRCTQIIHKIDVLHREVSHNNFVFGLYANPGEAVAKRKFVRACPANGCKGFLSTAWKCGLCEANVCSKCHEVKTGDEHACDPNSVATAEMLSRDSKPCPNCASIIFKIDGCDQMFCTQCHTAFSWRTGRIETQRIHNPHYYEYMMRQGAMAREPGDVVCGGLPHTNQIDTPRHRTTYSLAQRSDLFAIHRMHGHIQHVVLHRYDPARVADNRDLRIKYMMNEIPEAEFKKKIQQREKQTDKKREIREVLELYQTVTMDLMQKVAQDPQKNFVAEFHGIKEHVQDLLGKLATQWKCAVPTFTNIWVIK